VSTAAGFLGRKRAQRLEAEGERASLESLRAAVRTAPTVPSLTSALTEGEHVALIAEFKRRSPSGGPLTSEPPEEVAHLYAETGARAISVLTDAEDFGALPGDLERVGTAGLPMLCKDFILFPEEVLAARLAGASAVLLIVGLLEELELRELLDEALEAGIETLVEVHDGAELQKALAAGATLVGINNRDLVTLETRLATTERLAWAVPGGITLVAESGIARADDVRRMRNVGAHAVLVGESLLRLGPEERRERVRELSGVPR